MREKSSGKAKKSGQWFSANSRYSWDSGYIGPRAENAFMTREDRIIISGDLASYPGFPRCPTCPTKVRGHPGLQKLDQEIYGVSSRKSITLIFKIPLSSYQDFPISWRTTIFGKESPVSSTGFNSDFAFLSSDIEKAD